jgi:hypothetical protein
MNKGVEILLERIKTNPDEFMFDDEKPFVDSRWRKIISHYKPYLEEEDVKLLDTEINKHIQEAFTSAVMEELLDPKEEAQLTLNPSSTTMPLRTGTLSVGTTLGGSSGFNTISTLNSASLTLGNTTVDENALKGLLAITKKQKRFTLLEKLLGKK